MALEIPAASAAERRKFVESQRIESLIGSCVASRLDASQQYTHQNPVLPGQESHLLTMRSFIASRPAQAQLPLLADATSTSDLKSIPPSPLLSKTALKRLERNRNSIRPELKGYHLYAAQLKAQSQPLHKLLSGAHKAVLTKHWQLAREESKQMKVLTRIDELKANNLWSLRQLKPARPIPRPSQGASNWDKLLDEMKWMSEDFRQERKWKVVMASRIVRWVMDWHSAEDKSVLCIKPRPINFLKLEQPSESIETIESVHAASDVDEFSMALDIETLPKVENDESSTSHPADTQETQPEPEVFMDLVQPSIDPHLSAAEVKVTEAVPAVSQVEALEPIPPTESKLELIPAQLDFSSCVYTLEQPNAFASNRPRGVSDSSSSATVSARIYAPPLEAFPTPASIAAEDMETYPPLCSLFHERIVAKDHSRWDEYGRLRGYGAFSADEDIESVDSDLKVEFNFPESPLFGKTEQKLETASSIPPPSSPQPPDSILSKSIWVAEEDVVLLRMVEQETGYNWVYIAETLSSFRLGMGEVRNEWECYARYKLMLENREALALQAAAGGESAVVVPEIKTRKVDVQKRFGKRLGVFEFLLLRIRGRQERLPRKPDLNQKKVNLACHETHKQAQENAGVNLTGDVLGPGDISLMKEKREREFLMHQQSQRMFSFNTRMLQQPLIAGARPPNGLPFMQYPVQNPMQQVRPPMQRPINGMPGVPNAVPAGAGQPGATPQLQRMGSVTAPAGLGTPQPNSTSGVNGPGTPAQGQADQLQQFQQQLLNARRLIPGTTGVGPSGSPVSSDLSLQQQMSQMQMQQLMRQQVQMMQQQAAQGAMGIARPPGFQDAQMAAMAALQNAQTRPQVPVDPRQLAAIQQHQQAMLTNLNTAVASAAPESPLHSAISAQPAVGTNAPAASTPSASIPANASTPGTNTVSTAPETAEAKPEKTPRAPTKKQQAAAAKAASVAAAAAVVASVPALASASNVSPTITAPAITHSEETAAVSASSTGSSVRASRAAKGPSVVKNPAASVISDGKKRKETVKAAGRQNRKKIIEEDEDEEANESGEAQPDTTTSAPDDEADGEGEDEDHAGEEDDEEEEVEKPKKRVRRGGDSSASASAPTPGRRAPRKR
ncbi:chromatin modification- protein VID21 [Chytriomyces hyalinus]|nr:chromatin modification- protein VID21 [Chytriomyces hyalinus]